MDFSVRHLVKFHMRSLLGISGWVAIETSQLGKFKFNLTIRIIGSSH